MCAAFLWITGQITFLLQQRGELPEAGSVVEHTQPHVTHVVTELCREVVASLTSSRLKIPLECSIISPVLWRCPYCPCLSFSPSIVYIISAPASPVLGFMVDRTGRNVVWVIIAVVSTLAAHMMLAFTFWNPWIAMVLPNLATFFFFFYVMYIHTRL